MRISDWSSDVCSSDLRLRCSNSSTSPPRRAGEACRRTWRGRARRRRPPAIRASWWPQGWGAPFRSDLQAFDAARGGHVAAVLAGEARYGHVFAALAVCGGHLVRSEEHTSELQSLMRISYAGFCLKKTKQYQ